MFRESGFLGFGYGFSGFVFRGFGVGISRTGFRGRVSAYGVSRFGVLRFEVFSRFVVSRTRFHCSGSRVRGFEVWGFANGVSRFTVSVLHGSEFSRFRVSGTVFEVRGRGFAYRVLRY